MKAWLVLSIVGIAMSGAGAAAPHPGDAQRQTTRATRQLRDSRTITLPIVLAIEDARAATDGDLGVLLEAARVESEVQIAAIRALGRLERRDVITDLLPLLTPEATRAEAANAVAQALRGDRLGGVAIGQQEQAVLDALLAAGAAEMSGKRPFALAAVARSIGRLPFSRPDQIKSAEAFLRHVLDTPFPIMADQPHIGAARALESLARLNRKGPTFDEETLARLRILARTLDPLFADHRRNALAALVAAQGVDAETLKAALGDVDLEVRRLAILSAAGAGSVIGDDDRVAFIRDALKDASFMVRLEAVRAWARRAARLHGCRPLLDALDDKNLHVVLASLDALAGQCPDDSNVTNRLTTEATSPPAIGNWQREAHALVSLAGRAPDRAALRLSSFSLHTNWQVRMYAARAAALVGNTEALTRLAADPEDGVVEATLPALRKLLGAESDALFVAALNRRNRTVGRTDARPYQVIRTAAIALEGASATPALVGALADALGRITDEQCETSRDVRLALVTRLGELGSETQAASLTPLLRDIDPAVAHAAAVVLSAWTGKPAIVDLPLPVLRVPPTLEAIRKPASVVVEMESGKTFEIRFNDQAPLARTRFLELVSAPRPYYDGLTFHRVAQNFVIQGGSPNSHEYCGACPFARDEVGLPMNTRGTIGISTRGRDTGDSQIFINLVDSPRLDHEYTVFAHVCRDRGKDGMEVVDGIHEGDRMAHLRVITPGDACR